MELIVLDLIIITGMSGAGKSSAIDTLEDLGYFCVDNVPPQLIDKFVELHLSAQKHVDKMALVVDSRSFNQIDLFYDIINNQLKDKVNYKIIFFDASNDTLLKRYKENRRNHPMSRYDNTSVEDAILKERELLTPIRNSTEYIIDTTYSNTKEFKELLRKTIVDANQESMLVYLMSFGFKYGTPADIDLLFDVRCLPNPFYIEDLRNKTGLDIDVQDFVMDSPSSKTLLEKLSDLITFSLPLYKAEGKTRLVIAFGCTGGKHRSVTFAEKIYALLKSKNENVIVTHRDIERKPH